MKQQQAVVLDASVILKWLVRHVQQEAQVQQATSLCELVLGGQIAVIQPVHWLSEVVAGLSRITPDTAASDARMLHALELPIADTGDVMARGCAISTQLSHHYFDTLYHAVALGTRSVLVTADRRYLRKSQHLGQITDLSDWRSTLDV